MSRTHAQNWSIAHALSHIECACLMSFKLQNIATLVQAEGEGAFRSEERKLLGYDCSLCQRNTVRLTSAKESDAARRIWSLAVFTVRTWADALRGEHIFPMVNTISDGLSLAADKLISEFFF